jgi:hypothetical protein
MSTALVAGFQRLFLLWKATTSLLKMLMLDDGNPSVLWHSMKIVYISLLPLWEITDFYFQPCLLTER